MIIVSQSTFAYVIVGTAALWYEKKGLLHSSQ